MVKAIFFDVDGTLVSINTREALPSTIEALKKLREKGIKLFIATGRAMAMLKGVVDFEFDGYITLNGQQCYDDKGNILYEKSLDNADLKKMVEYVNKEKIACYFVGNNDIYCNLRNEHIDRLEYDIKIIKLPVKDVIIDEDTRIYQVSPCATPKQEEVIKSIMKNSQSTRWNTYFCDIYPEDGTKINGIERVCEKIGIDIEDTMAFGDSFNDVEMLDGVAISVAMGNADEDVKTHADYVTLDADSDGICHALRHYNLI